MSALGTAHNRYLLQYGAKLAPGSKEAAAFEQAKQIADRNARTELMTAPHAAMAGGDAWNSFGQFHAVRKAMEGLLGNKYGVGGISGGGDVNQRDTSGATGTFQLNAAPGSRTVPGDAGTDVYTGRSLSAPRTSAARASASAGSGDMDMDGLFGGGWGRADSPKGVMQELALRKLRAQLAPMEAEADSLAQMPPGSQAEVDALMGQAGRKRQIALDDAEAGAAQKSNQWWRYVLPQEEYKRGIAEQDAVREHGRATELARVKGEAATLDDLIRAGAGDRRTDATLQAALARLAATRANTLTTMGDDPSVYDADVQGRLAANPPGRAGGAGAGAGRSTQPRDGQRGRGANGERLIFLQNGPEGPDWYEE